MNEIERLKKICGHQDTWNEEDFDKLEELRNEDRQGDEE